MSFRTAAILTFCLGTLGLASIAPVADSDAKEPLVEQVRVAVKDQELAQRDALRPKPGHLLRNDLTGRCQRHGCDFTRAAHKPRTT